MPPKKGKKKGKKKKKKNQEPKHDSGWEKTLNNGKWERPLEALPDPTLWPTFAEIREKVLMSCQLISIIWSGAMQNDFIIELFQVPRINLITLELRGAKYITRFVMSPASICPVLQTLDLSCCRNLEYILIESSTLETMTLARCISLKKALIQARKLKELNLHETTSLTILMLWSDVLADLKLCCMEMEICEIYCPNLVNLEPPRIKVKEPPVPRHPAVGDIIRIDNVRAAALHKVASIQMDFAPYLGSSWLPHSYFTGF